MKNCCLIVLLAAPALAADPAIVIRNAAVETMSKDGRLEKATVVIRGGKITAVGKSAAIPDEATVIDAAGGTVMPGIIDPFFEVAVTGPAVDAGPRTVVIGGRTFQAPGGAGPTATVFTRLADNFYPYDAGFKPLPRIGFTKLNLVTNGTGQSAVIRATPGEPAKMMDKADGGAFVSVTNASGLDQLRSRLETGSRAASRSTSGGSRSPASTQLWADVIEGKAPLIVTAANAASIVHVLRLVEPHKSLKLTLLSTGKEFAEAADSLKGKSVRVLVHPNLELMPNTRDRFAPAKMLHDQGLEVVFSLTANPPSDAGAGENPAGHDFPLFPVAMMVKAGLPRQTALEALTKRPATLLGIESTHGTIETGKAADLVVYTGDPLDPASRIRMTIVDGRTTHVSE